MPDPTEILTDWKAKTDAATEGPWTWDGDSFDDADQESCPHGTEWTDHGPDLRAAGEGVITSWGYDASGLRIETADAEFIAMSRSAFPRLLAAVEAIRALHRPETRYVARGYEEYSFETRSDALEYGEEVTTFDVCVHCGRVETDDDEDRRYRDSIWPCATAKALDAALSGSEPDERGER